jgi:hypothetical protein
VAGAKNLITIMVFKFLEPSEPVQACLEIALPCNTPVWYQETVKCQIQKYERQLA